MINIYQRRIREHEKVFKPIEKVPEGANIITSRWVFKYKKNSKGEITMRKSRLVARDYTQQERN